MISPERMKGAALCHERRVAQVKSELESRGFTVSRTGYYDILPSEEYEKQPLSIRLTKLYPDLKAVSKKKRLYAEVKTELPGMVDFSHVGLQREDGENKLNGLQLAFFLNLYRLTGELTAYFFFSANGEGTACYADELISMVSIDMSGDLDALQYCNKAFNWMRSASGKS
jgi:hypothetical protein